MLKLTNLTKIFALPGGEQKVALDNVSLEINEGDFVTVIGSNGAGKSTLLNVIAGTYPVNSGSIELSNIDITNMKEHKRAKYIGRVFQDPLVGTAGSMQVEENIALAERRGKIHGLASRITKEEKHRYLSLLEQFDLGLEGRLHSPVETLSGGQRQALTLIMATLSNPQLLLLDEHTAALDPKTAHKVLELTDKFVKEIRVPTLMITHNMSDAIKYGNRLIMLHNGKIVFEASGKEKGELTVELLLKKFASLSKDIQMSDKMILG